MSWRLVAASVTGSSHTAANTSCQDSNWATPSGGNAEAPVLCAFVADGAGSAARGGEGAEMAMEAAARFMNAQALEHGFIPSGDILLECAKSVRLTIEGAATDAGLPLRDYACTFLGAVSAASHTALIQIGDGGIVIDTGDGLSMPIRPMSGEYANMTCFITDEDALDRVECRVFPGIAKNLAMFTDGIQRLATNMATHTPHEGFFTNFFRVLAASSAEDEEILHHSLVAFLSSPEVDERTDDDRTLVLASLLPQ
jgi:hypothetical protein